MVALNKRLVIGEEDLEDGAFLFQRFKIFASAVPVRRCLPY
jgi:hypothetical protein